jgi:hypothetical protein
MNLKISLSLFIIIVLANAQVFSQSAITKHFDLNWQPLSQLQNEYIQSVELGFEDAIASNIYIGLPAFHYQLPLKKSSSIKARITNAVFQEIADSLQLHIPSLYSLNKNIKVNSKINASMGKYFGDIYIETFRRNNGKIEKLLSFDLEIQQQGITDAKLIGTKGKSYAAHSVLKAGKWYKVRIHRSGIYKITAGDLSSMGFNTSNISLNQVKLFGNGGGMLPESNDTYYPDDILENAIEIHDVNQNGKFDASDYFLFYGQGPNPWNYNKSSKRFAHSKHLYDDYAFYFITIDQAGGGKRISTETTPSGNANKFVNNFTDYAFHNKDSLNLIKSGRVWFGEEFNIITNYKFSFSFPNIDSQSKVYVRTNAVARASVGSNMYYTFNGTQLHAGFAAYFNNYLAPYATVSTDTMTFKTSGSTINLQVAYAKPNNSAKAWLNFVELNVVRNLTMVGGQMSFRNTESIGSGNITEFTLENANNEIRIWDVSSPIEPKNLSYSLNGTTLKFKVATDSLRVFNAHKGDYYSVEKVGSVNNQDLHELSAVDYIIIYHPKFKKEAEELADFHRNHDQMNVLTVEPSIIYNEFSSGAKDISAIRNFMRMLYDRAQGNPKLMPRYLLFFGDASYDYKNRIQNNTNLLPTYESGNSLSPTTSYATDDYFGLLDAGEGSGSGGSLDVGIGRFPITTNEEARNILNKIYQYTAEPGLDTSGSIQCSNGSGGISNLADWRNIVCFIGDDEDKNLHVTQANYLADYVRSNYPVYNVDKIFFDAYPQIITPGGQRFPDVKDAIRNRVEKGALVINYTGHGGEEGWAHESVLEVSDINAWENSHNLPVFITATCEFSRYDDPGRTSAGELVLLNPKGGGIALLTTSRVTFATYNFTLGKAIYKNIFKKFSGEYPRLGDIIRVSKVDAGSIPHNKNFILLGDPALRLSYPQKDIITTDILNNNQQPTDTLKALAKITIKGEIQDAGTIMNNFNGFIYPTIYDKAQIYSTLGTDDESYPYTFSLQKSIIYKGKAEVKNGKFEFTFVVPKDISYQLGYGKISYYAQNGKIDANGYYDTINIGGSLQNADIDIDGPKIRLYINDTNFIRGGITDENPSLLAFVFDEHGINTVGNGIGHDIVAVLDENSVDPIVLNDYYESALNDYQSGSVRYPFSKLSVGTHTLSIKIWDVYNNSSTANTEFLVSDGEEMVLDHLLNAPNPFIDQTSFIFEHNQSCEVMNVEIEIYNSTGQLVKIINAIVNSNGYRVGAGQLTWNGTNDYGVKLPSGIYVYRLKALKTDGTWNEKTSKLIILRNN